MNPDDASTWEIYLHAMQRFNIDRHRGGVNAVFADGSCDKVALKSLWRLKWHKEFNTNGLTTTLGFI